MDSKTLAEIIQFRIEKSRKVYKYFFPLVREIDEPGVIKLFQYRKDYIAYINDPIAQYSIGLWMPNKKELIVSPPPSYSRTDKLSSMLETLVHEGFHQYIHYAASENPSSRWFNEGVAQFLESIEFQKGGRFTININERYPNLRVLVNRYKLDAKQLINTTPRSFMGSADFNYTYSWGLIYYLIIGSRTMGEHQYTKILSKYYIALINGQKEKQATAIAWQGINMSKFNRDFKNFWANEQNVHESQAVDICSLYLKKYFKFKSNLKKYTQKSEDPESAMLSVGSQLLKRY